MNSCSYLSILEENGVSCHMGYVYKVLNYMSFF